MKQNRLISLGVITMLVLLLFASSVLTPRIDKLASEGTRLTNFNVEPSFLHVCRADR